MMVLTERNALRDLWNESTCELFEIFWPGKGVR